MYKRIPFGFKGQWGKVYKLYNQDVINGDVLEYQESRYLDIGNDVQFRYLEKGIDKTTIITDEVKNLISLSHYRVIVTSDCILDTNYVCVANIGDIVYFENEYWIVDKIEERSIFTPKKQTFYYIGMKKIFDNVVRKEYK